MATEHEAGAPDAAGPAGGVPRHASARERKSRGIRPFLSDLRAEVRSQLTRAETPGRGSEDEHATRSLAPVPAQHHTPFAGADGAVVPAPAPRPDAALPTGADGAALAAAALAAADHAGAAAEAAGAEATAARQDAATARSDAAAARTSAAHAESRIQAARDEIDAAHQEFAGLRAELTELRSELDAVRERTGRQAVIAWAAAGAGVVLAAVALVLAL